MKGQANMHFSTRHCHPWRDVREGGLWVDVSKWEVHGSKEGLRRGEKRLMVLDGNKEVSLPIGSDLLSLAFQIEKLRGRQLYI